MRHDGIIVRFASHRWFNEGGDWNALVWVVMLLEESVASAEVVSELCREHDLGVVDLPRLRSIEIWRHYCLRVAWMEIA